MAHVWNIQDGDIYVSKNGDDVAGDGSMAAPYASINKATDVGSDGDKIVIGTGVWSENRGTSIYKFHFIGDGIVIFRYDSSGYFIPLLNVDDGSDILESIILENMGITFPFYGNRDSLADLNPLNFIRFVKCNIDSLYLAPTNKASLFYAENCLIRKITYKFNLPDGWLSLYFKNNTILEFYFPIDLYSAINFYYFVNNIVYQYNCHLSRGYVIKIVGNNLIKNLINDDKNVFDGINIIGLDPFFNDIEAEDFSLSSNSPALYAGKNNSTIGAFGLGYSLNANSSEFTKEGGAVFSQTSTEDDIIRTQQTINGVTRFLFQLAAGHASGNVESGWIDLQQIRYLLITRLFANIIYNASGVATSRPDNLESAGEKAVYYDFELKYCNEESEKDTAAWRNVIWNKAVTVDNAGNGNADPAFVANEAQYISARFIKIKIYMTEA